MLPNNAKQLLKHHFMIIDICRNKCQFYFKWFTKNMCQGSLGFHFFGRNLRLLLKLFLLDMDLTFNFLQVKWMCELKRMTLNVIMFCQTHKHGKLSTLSWRTRVRDSIMNSTLRPIQSRYTFYRLGWFRGLGLDGILIWKISRTTLVFG